MDSLAASRELGLYPPYEPYAVHRLTAAKPHVLYVEEAGRHDGPAVLFLHGGPGFTWSGHNRRFCDPSFWRFVGFDQRGAWRSTPLGALEGNTTQALVEDIERIRVKLGIERWVVLGGSWGSALALAYALAHRERCIGLVLWGIYLGLASENEFNYVTSRKIFPEAWEALVAPLSPEERGDIMEAYRRRILDENSAVHMPALKIWLEHNAATSNLKGVDEEFRRPDAGAEVFLAGARIALNYFSQTIYLPDGELLRRAPELGQLPGVLVHGRDDLVCPIENAYDLAKAWRGARFHAIEHAGHHPFEPGIARQLAAAMEEMKGLA
jgi:proline iminopeptidase